MVEKLEVSRDIAASPEAVYAAISDVTRMGVDDRAERNRHTMSGTLERLAAALED